MIHRFCISHKKPLLPASWYDDCISLGSYQADSECHVSRFDRFWHEARPISYGAAGTYVLPIAIERFASTAQLIEISSYRKRIFPSPEGTQSQIYPIIRELNVENLASEAELSVVLPRADRDFLVARPISFEDSLLEQYTACHYRRDILDYLSLAVEMGVLDSNAASELLAAKKFIPGGVELGIFPKTWLTYVMSIIELVGRQFLYRFGQRVRKYNVNQVRAVGFLSETLGSFLLIRHLAERYSNNIPGDIFGYMISIVENNSSYSAGFADGS